jgi:hypothetical protein
MAAECHQQYGDAVVVGAADDVDEDQGVEGDERRGAQGVDAAGWRHASDEQCGGENSSRGDRLEDVDGSVDGQPGERVGHQGEEGPVGAGGFAPGDLRKDWIRRHAQRRIDVGIEAVQGPQASIVDVAVDVV